MPCILLVTILLASHTSTAQSCNPAVLEYIVRDEKGDVLGEAELKNVASALPKTIGDANVDTGQVSFAADKKTYYWPESVDWPKGNKVGVIQFANAGTCTMHLPEVTLEYHGKKMRLIFNVDISRTQNDRRPVVDALPFQEGTFQLDLSDWTRAEDQLIPATRWKKTK